MLCEKCHKAEANIHIQDMSGEQKKSWHLCSSCAAQELAMKATSGSLDLSKLLEALAAQASALPGADSQPEEPEREVKITCGRCGMTDVEFEKGRRAGCAECYHAFADMVASWLLNLHRDTIHRGQRPGRPSSEQHKTRTTIDIEMLRREMERAVAAEAYERAAELRDAIDTRKENA